MSRDAEHTGSPGTVAVPGGRLVALLVSEPADVDMLSEDTFVEAGFSIVRATTIEAADELCRSCQPHLVVMPLALQGHPTTPHLKLCLAARPAPAVVVVASHEQINTAAEAMRLGALDCLFRPVTRTRLATAIAAATETLGIEAGGFRADPEHDAPEPQPDEGDPAQANADPFPEMVARSADMRALLERAAALARSDTPILITGAVGTGKSRVAAAIHSHSGRAAGPLEVLDCAALSSQGADAPASLERAFARAAGGTLVIDELTELAPALQPALLQRVGAIAGQELPRLLITSTPDPRGAVESGALRSDLYYRLAVARLSLPPLSARRDDIAVLALAMLHQHAAAEGRAFSDMSQAAALRLAAHAWPGNLHELSNTIRAAVIAHDGPVLKAEHLPPEILASEAGAQAARHNSHARGGPAPALDQLVGRTLAEIERMAIEATIEAQGGSVPRAALVLDVSPSTLYRKREAWAKAADPSANRGQK